MRTLGIPGRRRSFAVLRYLLNQNRRSVEPLPAFDGLKYEIATRPPQAKALAWDKLEELERRLLFYQWAESLNDPAQPQHRVLLNDAESAFLLTLEAVIQHLKDQWPTGSSSFEAWIRSELQNDLTLRGLRTLRHLEAHVESRPAESTIVASVGTPNPSLERRWRLASLTPEDLRKVHHAKISDGELAAWNDAVTGTSAHSILREALVRLAEVVRTAEAML